MTTPNKTAEAVERQDLEALIAELEARANARHSGEASPTARLCARAAQALSTAQQSDARVREALEEIKSACEIPKHEYVLGGPRVALQRIRLVEAAVEAADASLTAPKPEEGEAAPKVNVRAVIHDEPGLQSDMFLTVERVEREDDGSVTATVRLPSPLASPAPSRVEPVEEVIVKPDDLQDLLIAAYEEGAHATHAHYQPDPDPCFKEAAWDYVAGLDFTATTRPLRTPSAPPDAQPRIEALEKENALLEAAVMGHQKCREVGLLNLTDDEVGRINDAHKNAVDAIRARAVLKAEEKG